MLQKQSLFTTKLSIHEAINWWCKSITKSFVLNKLCFLNEPWFYLFTNVINLLTWARSTIILILSCSSTFSQYMSEAALVKNISWSYKKVVDNIQRWLKNKSWRIVEKTPLISLGNIKSSSTNIKISFSVMRSIKFIDNR